MGGAAGRKGKRDSDVILLTKKKKNSKNIEADTRWKDHLCLSINTVNMLKMVKFVTVICRFNEIAVKTPMTFFTKLENTILKFIWKQRIS